jgi:TonB family protein
MQLRLILVLLLLAGLPAALPVHAQGLEELAETSKGKSLIDNVYNTCWAVEEMPELPGGGGTTAILNAIKARVIYPKQAVENKTEGRVFVNFWVGEEGLVRNIKVLRGIGDGCDEAVISAVQQLPQFIPARQNSKPVAVSYTLPINFVLPAPVPAKVHRHR